METVNITRRTRAIGAPANWDHSKAQCGVLCVRDEIDKPSGAYTMTSAWKPHPSELAALNNGMPILLTIYGRVHPVVAMGVGTPADQVEDGQ